MIKKDLFFVLIALCIIFPFVPFPFLGQFHKGFLYNPDFWILTSCIKFALLATLGEVLGLRIKAGRYMTAGFGIIPRAIVWGIIGIFIKLAFDVFSAGAPSFLLKSCHVVTAIEAMTKKDIFDAAASGMGWIRLLDAFAISTIMNITFAPVMMTFHKITDTHISNNGGTLAGFFRPIKYGEIFSTINWKVQWNFVFKRTIPLFWIPAHTITFLMPSEFRVVFAALLGIALGVILAIASQKGKSK